MAYVKQEWKNEVLNGAEKYKITRSDGTILAENVSVELITQILQAGTGITAERMNHIEDGIAGITPESIGAMNAEPIGIDLGKALPPNAGHGGFIDFHWNGSADDYTSRIISTSEDTIAIEKNLVITGNLYIAGNVGNANLLTDTGWIDMVLANGWTRIEGGLARFRKYLNIVFVVGQLYGGVATSPAFIQLPAGYRPHTRTEFACVRDDNTPVTGVVTHDGIMWLTTLTYGNTLCFSGSWLGEL